MSVDPAKKLLAFIKKLPPPSEASAAVPHVPSRSDPVTLELVRSFLTWEAGTPSGVRSLAQVDAATADYNELRVCLPHELGRMLTIHDDRFDERALRLRSVLNDIYRREHELSLAHLLQLPKRDARAYLESLDGMQPFVSARVCLLALGAHAVPVDSRVVSALADENAIPEELETAPHADCASWLEHHIRAEESASVYTRLEAYLDAAESAAPQSSPASKRKSVNEKSKPAPRRAKAAVGAKKRPQA